MRRRWLGWWMAAVLALGAAVNAPGQNEAPLPKLKPTSGTVLVVCDVACNWTLDGKTMGSLDGGEYKKAPVSLGHHVIGAVANGSADKVEQEVAIKSAAQVLVRLELQPVRNARVKAKQGAVAAAEPTPDTTAQQLQSKLLSLGRVNYALTTRNTSSGETKGPAQAWEEVASLALDAHNCKLKVKWNSSEGNQQEVTYFLEELDVPRVLPSQEHLNLIQPEMEHTVTPTVYSVSFASSGMDFKASDQQSATEIAASFVRLIAPCKAVEPRSAGDGQTFAETLSFIETKLNGEGAVNWTSTLRDTKANTTGNPTLMSYAVSNLAQGKGACMLSFHFKLTADGKMVREGSGLLNFRRIEKVEGNGLQEDLVKVHTTAGHPELVESISPKIYELTVSGEENRTAYLPFADEELAKRIARAMSHAAELCGGNKDIF